MELPAHMKYVSLSLQVLQNTELEVVEKVKEQIH